MLPIEVWQLISEYCRLVEMKNRITKFETVFKPARINHADSGTWFVLRIKNSKALYVFHCYVDAFYRIRTSTYYPDHIYETAVTFPY